jgi:hypothetical protein
VFPARYELNSYIVFRKRLVSKRLNIYIYIYIYIYIRAQKLGRNSNSHELGDRRTAKYGLESNAKAVFQYQQH